MERLQLAQSDVISFHDYSWPETFERRVRQLLPYNRPILCTEYGARQRIDLRRIAPSASATMSR
jgi:hypothetical protein